LGRRCVLREKMGPWRRCGARVKMGLGMVLWERGQGEDGPEWDDLALGER
jgi:hypothetical protein